MGRGDLRKPASALTAADQTSDKELMKESRMRFNRVLGVASVMMIGYMFY
jgi:hypothetical protein